MYVYIKTEPDLYTVGFYSPNGFWHADKDCDNKTEAAERIHYLNGGDPPITLEKAALMIAQGRLAYQTIPATNEAHTDFAYRCVAIAKTVIEQSKL